MKRNKSYLFYLGLAAWLLSAACSQIERPRVEESGEHSCELRIAGGVTGFSESTRAEGGFNYSRENRLYLRMVAGGQVVLGEATYQEETESWTLTYHGSLNGATQGSATAVLFERVRDVLTDRVFIDYSTPIYEDPAAAFTMDGSGITLSATFSPKTGRLSFVHDLEEGQGRGFRRISGLKIYDAFDLAEFRFSEIESVRQNWFSFERGRQNEYLYASFATPDDPYILFYDWDAFYRHLPASVLDPGQSGYVDHWDVSQDGWDIYWTHGQWLEGIKGSAGVDMVMRYCPGGTFSMGNASDPEASPVHSVTLPHYYIGETEVTKAMWYNVMGEPSDWANNPQPVNYRSYDEILRFIAELNQKTGRRFRLPTEAEWEFAARGGIFSDGFTYSGSNILEKVANRRDFAVASLERNELQLFDMSGNIAELCSDWYGPYTSEAVTSPTGPASGQTRVIRGGHHYDNETRFTVWARAKFSDYGEDRNDEVGFRLVMEVPSLR